ncbi:MAG TPA: HIT family protein [Candidatus Limnocylindria bacterium]|nr:HIT family protein [Candidatus Limnocylindria bacterium]
MNGAVVRAYRPGDRAAVRAIAFATGYMGEPVDWLWGDRESFAHVITKYYTDREPELLLVAEQGGRVVGYLSGCADSRAASGAAAQEIARLARQGAFFRPGSAAFFWRSLVDLVAVCALRGAAARARLSNPPRVSHARAVDGALVVGSAMACLGCDCVALARSGRNPDFVAELSESIVTLADEQAYRGYCILYLKDHEERLSALSLERQGRLWDDVARVAAALERTLTPVRINYACLGNMLHHVHWHVTPRYADDPEPQHPIWVRPLAERRLALPATERVELVKRLRQALG